MKILAVFTLVLSALHLFTYVSFMAGIDIDSDVLTYIMCGIMLSSPILGIITTMLYITK